MVNMPSIYELFIGPYTSIIGGWFWAFFLILAVIAVYIRVRSFGPPYLLLVVGSTILSTVLPGGNLDTLLFFSIALGIAYTAYRFFVQSGRR